jgi:hypothetical protein
MAAQQQSGGRVIRHRFFPEDEDKAWFRESQMFADGTRRGLQLMGMRDGNLEETSVFFPCKPIPQYNMYPVFTPLLPDGDGGGRSSSWSTDREDGVIDFNFTGPYKKQEEEEEEEEGEKGPRLQLEQKLSWLTTMAQMNTARINRIVAIDLLPDPLLDLLNQVADPMCNGVLSFDENNVRHLRLRQALTTTYSRSWPSLISELTLLWTMMERLPPWPITAARFFHTQIKDLIWHEYSIFTDDDDASDVEEEEEEEEGIADEDQPEVEDEDKDEEEAEEGLLMIWNRKKRDISKDNGMMGLSEECNYSTFPLSRGLRLKTLRHIMDDLFEWSVGRANDAALPFPLMLSGTTVSFRDVVKIVRPRLQELYELYAEMGLFTGDRVSGDERYKTEHKFSGADVAKTVCQTFLQSIQLLASSTGVPFAEYEPGIHCFGVMVQDVKSSASFDFVHGFLAQMYRRDRYTRGVVDVVEIGTLVDAFVSNTPFAFAAQYCRTLHRAAGMDYQMKGDLRTTIVTALVNIQKQLQQSMSRRDVTAGMWVGNVMDVMAIDKASAAGNMDLLFQMFTHYGMGYIMEEEEDLQGSLLSDAFRLQAGQPPGKYNTNGIFDYLHPDIIVGTWLSQMFDTFDVKSAPHGGLLKLSETVFAVIAVRDHMVKIFLDKALDFADAFLSNNIRIDVAAVNKNKKAMTDSGLLPVVSDAFYKRLLSAYRAMKNLNAATTIVALQPLEAVILGHVVRQQTTYHPVIDILGESSGAGGGSGSSNDIGKTLSTFYIAKLVEKRLDYAMAQCRESLLFGDIPWNQQRQQQQVHLLSRPQMTRDRVNLTLHYALTVRMRRRFSLVDFVVFLLFTPQLQQKENSDELLVNIISDPFGEGEDDGGSVDDDDDSLYKRVRLVLEITCQPGGEGQYRAVLYHPKYGFISSRSAKLTVEQTCQRTGQTFQETNNGPTAVRWQRMHATMNSMSRALPQPVDYIVRRDNPLTNYEFRITTDGWHSADERNKPAAGHPLLYVGWRLAQGDSVAWGEPCSSSSSPFAACTRKKEYAIKDWIVQANNAWFGPNIKSMGTCAMRANVNISALALNGMSDQLRGKLEMGEIVNDGRAKDMRTRLRLLCQALRTDFEDGVLTIANREWVDVDDDDNDSILAGFARHYDDYHTVFDRLNIFPTLLQLYFRAAKRMREYQDAKTNEMLKIKRDFAYQFPPESSDALKAGKAIQMQGGPAAGGGGINFGGGGGKKGKGGRRQEEEGGGEGEEYESSESSGHIIKYPHAGPIKLPLPIFPRKEHEWGGEEDEAFHRAQLEAKARKGEEEKKIKEKALDPLHVILEKNEKEEALLDAKEANDHIAIDNLFAAPDGQQKHHQLQPGKLPDVKTRAEKISEAEEAQRELEEERDYAERDRDEADAELIRLDEENDLIRRQLKLKELNQEIEFENLFLDAKKQFLLLENIPKIAPRLSRKQQRHMQQQQQQAGKGIGEVAVGGGGILPNAVILPEKDDAARAKIIEANAIEASRLAVHEFNDKQVLNHLDGNQNQVPPEDEYNVLGVPEAVITNQLEPAKLKSKEEEELRVIRDLFGGVTSGGFYDAIITSARKKKKTDDSDNNNNNNQKDDDDDVGDSGAYDLAAVSVKFTDWKRKVQQIQIEAKRQGDEILDIQCTELLLQLTNRQQQLNERLK